MGIRIKLYTFLVNRVPGIRERYHERRGTVHGVGRVCLWGRLLWWNFAYHALRRREPGIAGKYAFYEEKILCAEGSESARSQREGPEELAKRLAAYDVISFDVFDTLLFRPFSRPADLFYAVAEKLRYPDFCRIRQEMEGRAREERQRKEGDREVSFEEIYAVLERETGIGREEGMQAELEAERRYCFANPYMLRVVEEIRKYGKRIIVTSDMYLEGRHIRHLLRKAGYGSFDACYVSNEYRCSKQGGELYGKVKEREGSGKRYVHVGDNPFSDIERAKQYGFDTVYYKNVNDAGRPFRPEDMSAIGGSIYRGIVNAHLHNGCRTYGLPYEYGFIYGGWFAVGYCQFIHGYARRREAGKILFLSRDGAVLSRVYRRLYPEECQEYVYWSRLAAAKLTAGRYKYDYFRRFLYHKVNQGHRLKDILCSMELEDMLGNLCKEGGWTPETRLTDRNVEKVKAFFQAHWQETLAHYEGQVRAAGAYYREALRGVTKAVAVDIGWAGSGAVALAYMAKEVWGLGCEVTGLLAGTNSSSAYERDCSEAQLESGQLASYLFSQKENRDIWKFHDAGKNHNLYWEMLLGAAEGSCRGFYPDGDGGCRIVFKEGNGNGEAVEEIHRGILDFTDRYLQAMGGKRLEISGRDAYAPMLLAERGKNREYMQKLEYLMDEAGI